MIQNSDRFFRNVDCQYFPCHEGADPERFNCLFCFCPLYAFEGQCGGNFCYVGKNENIKSCMDCALPHDPAFYDVIIEKLKAREA